MCSSLVVVNAHYVDMPVRDLERDVMSHSMITRSIANTLEGHPLERT